MKPAVGFRPATHADAGFAAAASTAAEVSHSTVSDIPKSVEYIPEPYEEWVVWMLGYEERPGKLEFHRRLR